MVQEYEKRLEFVCADDVNILGENINKTQKLC
jgi:hypothetical protein